MHCFGVWARTTCLRRLSPDFPLCYSPTRREGSTHGSDYPGPLMSCPCEVVTRISRIGSIGNPESVPRFTKSLFLYNYSINLIERRQVNSTIDKPSPVRLRDQVRQPYDRPDVHYCKTSRIWP
ncbi:hypothetical protein C7212DRAFT_320924 [Tuber magnatum]|uniref:Uncharacterized protein n=1 Tax=Tuber magnatum TaxID=42249 RepID=A0A317SNB1_9PEZI|nr:hypothetical protein C7212DRAFT_320924 [Tuber magnatum]